MDRLDELLGTDRGSFADELDRITGDLEESEDALSRREALLEGNLNSTFYNDARFEDEYDTSTREGREKLAKDIHRTFTEDSMLGSMIKLQDGYGMTKSNEEFIKDIEQRAYEKVMKQGATEREVSGRDVYDALSKSGKEVKNESSGHIDSALEEYGLGDSNGPLEDF